MPDARIIPSVEHLRQRPGVARLLDAYGHASVVEATQAHPAAVVTSTNCVLCVAGTVIVVGATP